MDSQELQNKFWMNDPNGVVIDKVKQLIPYNLIFKLGIFSNIKWWKDWFCVAYLAG
jgi:hypothetical protein